MEVRFSTGLRLIFACALYLYHLFAKALEIRHIYRQSYTSVYLSTDVHGRTFLDNGVRAAAENPQRRLH